MSSLELYLYEVGILKFHRLKILKWLAKADITRIRYAMTHGLYDTRMICIEALVSIRHFDLTYDLLMMIDDPVRCVSEVAMNNLEKMTTNESVIETIQKKRKYWRDKSNREKAIMRKSLGAAYGGLLNSTTNDTYYTYYKQQPDCNPPY